MLECAILSADVERGIARQRAIDPGFADALAAWLDRVLTLSGERVVPFDLRAARRLGALMTVPIS
jgi:hypothetical protein